MIPEIFEFNHDTLGVRPKDVPHLEHNHAAFCCKAIREEAKELQDQHVIRHPEIGEVERIWSDPNCEEARWQTVHSIDALIDAAYFAIGGLARAGLTPNQASACFLAVHLCNMRKKMGVKAERGDMGVPDAVKPEDWTGPEQVIYNILFKPALMESAAVPEHWNADGSPRPGNPLLGEG